MPRRNDAWLKSFISRICEQIEEYHGKPASYIEVQALIQRFVKNNPDADPSIIDWVSYYDPELEYSEILGRLARAYPQYRWEAEEEKREEVSEERYFNELLNYLSRQARELPPELRLRLIRELEKAVEVKPPVKREKKPVIIDLALLARYPILDEIKSVVSAFTFDDIDDRVYERASLIRLSFFEGLKLFIRAEYGADLIFDLLEKIV